MPGKLRLVITIVAFVVFCVSAYSLARNYHQEYTANRDLDNIRQAVIIETPASPGETGSGEEDAFFTLSIDFETLFEINPDIVAWLYIPGTPISYPLLHGSDNHFYLTHTFDRKANALGSIFLDYRNDPDFADFNTIIYGHNTRDDAMFGSLKRFKEQAYADENGVIHILKSGLSGEALVYEIFSVYETPGTSDTYTIRFPSEEAFAEYIKKMASGTIVDTGSLSDASRIITLSTCTPNDRDTRLVIQAKLVH